MGCPRPRSRWARPGRSRRPESPSQCRCNRPTAFAGSRRGSRVEIPVTIFGERSRNAVSRGYRSFLIVAPDRPEAHIVEDVERLVVAAIAEAAADTLLAIAPVIGAIVGVRTVIVEEWARRPDMGCARCADGRAAGIRPCALAPAGVSSAASPVAHRIRDREKPGKVRRCAGSRRGIIPAVRIQGDVISRCTVVWNGRALICP